MSYEEQYQQVKKRVKESIVNGTELEEKKPVDPFQQKLEKYGVEQREGEQDPFEKKLEKYK